MHFNPVILVIWQVILAGVGVGAVNLWWLLKIDKDKGAVVDWRGSDSTGSTASTAGLAALTACVSELSSTRWISGTIMSMIWASTRLSVPSRTVKLTLMELVEFGTSQTAKLALLVGIGLLVDLLVTTVVVFHIVRRVLFFSVAEAAAGEHEEDKAGAEQSAYNPRLAPPSTVEAVALDQ